jgi:colanic acid/amylovoran biosynthesis protein
MKKIVILHSKSTLNYGSFMMTINAVNFLHSQFPDAKFLIELDQESDIDRVNDELLNKVNYEVIKSVPEYLESPKGVKDLKRLIGYRTQSRKVLAFDPDYVIYLGGDDFSEYYNKYKVLVELYWANIFSKKAKVIFMGHTVGPFRLWRKPLVSRFFKNSSILTRDSLSYRHLTDELGIQNVIESHDLAFLNLPAQGQRADILKHYSLSSQDYLSLIPSALHSHYCASYEDYTNGWIEIIRLLLNDSALSEKKILLFAHVIKLKKIDDRAMIKEIISRIQKDKSIDSSRVIVITDILLPSQAREILGNGLFTITGRMHGAINTFQMGTPAIPLSYSVKYRGVIGESLQQQKLIIEATDDELWKSGDIVQTVSEKVAYVLENRDSLSKDISSRVNVLQKEIVENLEKALS